MFVHLLAFHGVGILPDAFPEEFKAVVANPCYAVLGWFGVLFQIAVDAVEKGRVIEVVRDP